MSQKQLTAKVRLNTTQAESAIDRLSKKINNLNKAVNGISNNNNIGSNIGKATTQTNKLNRALSQTNSKVQTWANKQLAVNGQLKTTGSLLSSTNTKLKRLINTYLGVMGLRAMINTSDIITASENKLNNVNATQLGAAGVNADGSYSVATINATRDAMDKMYNSSQKVRMSYTDMMSNVAKSMTLAGDAFQNNTDNAIRFQEIMAEAYAIGGASAPEMSTSMYQLMQALGSGVLAGDELRSVREGAPIAYKAIEEFAQGVYKTEESLKDLGSQGKITSDMVVAAIMNAGNEMDMAFAQTAQTFAQTWEQIKNVAKKAFEPVSRMLRDALNRAIDNDLISKFETVFGAISKVLQGTFQIIEKAIVWIVDNWSWLKDYVVAGLMVMAAYYIVVGSIAVATAIKTAIAWAITHWQMLLVIAALAAVFYTFYLVQTGVISLTDAIVILGAITVAVLVVIALALNITWLLWVALAVALLTLAFNFFEQVCGGVMWLLAVIADILILLANLVMQIFNYILGLICWGIATIHNLFVGFLNALIQLIYALFVDPIKGIVEWFTNAFSGGFNGILGAGANAIGQLVNMFLSGLKVITKAIDAVAGTNYTAKISGWQESAVGWGKKSNAVTFKAEVPELKRISATNAFSQGASTYEYLELINPMDAYSTGAEWGSNVKKSINAWGSDKMGSLTDELSKLSLDKISSKLGLNVVDPFLGSNGVGDGGIGSGYDPNNALKGIKGDTGKMADAMDLTQEDLEYLRDVANMEWKKEFTTASIVVDMSNYNTINGDNDLDGIVTKLTDRLYEELQSVADGVYV